VLLLYYRSQSSLSLACPPLAPFSNSGVVQPRYLLGSSRSNKPKAGPRKLNLTRISAEKQRAALCLDKVVDDEADGSSGVRFGSAPSYFTS